MPTVKPLTEGARKDKSIKAELLLRMKEEHMSHEDVAEKMGISLNTLYRKRDEPEKLTLKDIRNLQQIFPGMKIE